MTKELRVKIIYLYFEGYTTGEIAKELGINEVDVVKVVGLY